MQRVSGEIQRQNLEKAKRKAGSTNPEDTSLQQAPGQGVTGGPLSRSSSQESMTQYLGNVAPTVPVSVVGDPSKAVGFVDRKLWDWRLSRNTSLFLNHCSV